MKKHLFTALVALLLPVALFAGNLRFSNMIGDNMVLQQSTSATLWGYASPKATVTVTVSWSQSPVTAKADAKGQWQLAVQTPAASFDPQTIKAESNGETVTASNVLIGEVWFCSGQSNMEMSLGGGFGTPVDGSLEEVAMSGQYKGVRHFAVKKTTPLEPAYDVEGEWQISNPKNSPRFSAVAYYFASRLSKALDIPVGVINSSWGGSMISPWMSKESLAAYPKVNLPDATDDSVNAMFKPYVMYNGMFKPVSKYAINGIIWYQGESNVSTRVDDYAAMLQTMVGTWRKDIGRGDIPFLIVELPPYEYYDGNYGLQDEHGPLIREQQFMAYKAIPNCGLIGTNDLAFNYEQNQVHPSQKRQVGERACYLAMNMAYGYPELPAQNPEAKSAYVDGTKVYVYFDNARNGFLGCDEVIGFEIAGQGGYFKPADVETGFSFGEGAYVILSSKDIPEPATVRYCYKDFQVGTLKGANGLPVIPFSLGVKPISEKPASPMPRFRP